MWSLSKMSKCVPLLGPKHPPVTSRASSKKGKSTQEHIGATCKFFCVTSPWQRRGVSWFMCRSQPPEHVRTGSSNIFFFVETQKIASFLKNSEINEFFSPRSTNRDVFSCVSSEKGGDDMCLGELKQMVTVSPVWLPGSAKRAFEGQRLFD